MYYNRIMEDIRILMIEDNSFVQRVVTAQLEKSTVWRFEITATDCMEKALKLKNTREFDIVLADLELPDSNRQSTLHILKNEFSALPFVILTGDDDDNLLLQSLEAGARNYLCKDYLQQGALLSRTLFNALGHWKIEKELIYTATHDHLTGAYNKKHFIELLKDRIKMFDLDESPFCLVICDLDNFRDINNNYGHMTGDRALQLFVQTLRETIRNKDSIGRFGGDEFCLLFPQTEKERCGRYLNKLTGLKIELPGFIKISGSYGGAEYEKGMTAEELIIKADKALYKVKEGGKGFNLVL